MTRLSDGEKARLEQRYRIATWLVAEKSPHGPVLRKPVVKAKLHYEQGQCVSGLDRKLDTFESKLLSGYPFNTET